MAIAHEQVTYIFETCIFLLLHDNRCVTTTDVLYALFDNRPRNGTKINSNTNVFPSKRVYSC